LASYDAALDLLRLRHIGPAGFGNSRVDNAHLPIWRRERQQQRFKSQASAQRFLTSLNIVAHHLADVSAELSSVGSRDGAFPLAHGRGDEFHHGSPTPDPRGMPKARNMVDPYLHLAMRSR